jgi:ABC-type antimicrobial peptide transport system permease subunit
MVLREAGGLALLGVIAGLALSLFLARLVKSMLYGLQLFDPVSLIAAAALIHAAAFRKGCGAPPSP